MRGRFVTLPMIGLLAVLDLALVALLSAGGGLVADLVLAALLAGVLVLQVRLWRSGLDLGPEGVVVRSLLGDTAVPWPQVEGLEQRRNAAGGYLVGVRLADGRVLLTQGLVARDLAGVSRFEEQLARARVVLAG
ncbi:MAG: PH domain-containing protein [Mycobacteriales bacterium]